MTLDIFNEVKQAVTMPNVAQFYGFSPNRAGFICCPFHGEKTPSMKLYNGSGGFHCFGCGVGGSVIDFAMRLFDINFRQAVLRLNTDFNLGLTGEKRTRAEQSAILEQRRREAARRAELEAEHHRLAAEYRYYWEITIFFPPVLTEQGEMWVHPFYPEAVRALPALEHRLDEIIRSIGR